MEIIRGRINNDKGQMVWRDYMGEKVRVDVGDKEDVRW